MGNFKKTVWTSILFFALLAPFVVVLALMMRTHISPARIQAAQMIATSQAAAATNQLILTVPTTQPAASDANPSLLAAGDGGTLWVAHPVPFEDHGVKTHTYELLQRASNTGIWSQAQSEEGVYFGGFPNGLVAVGNGSAVPAADAYLFNNGSITRFNLMDHSLAQALPAGQKLIADAGGVGEMFALTFGKPASAMADRNQIEVPVPDALAEEAAATTHAASAPATTTAGIAEAMPSNNAYWFHDGQWFDLPAMSGAGQGDNIDWAVPGESAMAVMAAHDGRLEVLWVNPGARNEVMARSLEYGKEHAAWSKAIVSQLPEVIPVGSRLFSVTLDQSVYVLWPVFRDKTIFLHGARLTETTEEGAGEMTLAGKNFLRPMNLGPMATGQDGTDIAVGSAENSFAVLVEGERGALTCQLFDDRGEPTGKATAVEPKSPRHDALLAKDIAILLMVVMAGLSIWQWNQRPTALVLPAHAVIAPLYQRGIAFLIDLAIPAAAATIIFGMGDLDMLLSAWSNSLVSPDELLKTPQLVYTLVFYVTLTTLGELFFRRSIGKAIVGLQVLMLDGKAPTVAAVLLRNLVRIPEILFGFLVVYVLISDSRQRFGDWLAGTVVVSQRTPETPEDPDAGDKSNKKEEKKDEMAGAGRGERLR